MSEISEQFQELVREHGERVDIHSKVCVLWKSEHGNCAGCPSEFGCAKAVAMFGISVTSVIYSPKDYNDFQRMHQDIQERLDKVLHAKSVEEVQSII